MYFIKQHFFLDHFSGCEITAEGIKSISSFLSQDEIVLEELNLTNKFGNSFFNSVIISNIISIGYTRHDLIPIEEAIVDKVLTNINLLVDTSFNNREVDFNAVNYLPLKL